MTDAERLAQAIDLLKQAAGDACDMCEDDGVPWLPEGLPNEYWHGSGEEIGQCESMIMQTAIDLGLIQAKTYPKCVKGHDWYGEGCEFCEADAYDEDAVSRAAAKVGEK